MSKYPQHDKLEKVKDRSQAVGEFVDWLWEQNILLAHYQTYPGYSTPQLTPVHESLLNLLARWTGIDLTKLDNEKRAMLEIIRAKEQSHELDPRLDGGPGVGGLHGR